MHCFLEKSTTLFLSSNAVMRLLARSDFRNGTGLLQSRHRVIAIAAQGVGWNGTRCSVKRQAAFEAFLCFSLHYGRRLLYFLNTLLKNVVLQVVDCQVPFDLRPYFTKKVSECRRPQNGPSEATAKERFLTKEKTLSKPPPSRGRFPLAAPSPAFLQLEGKSENALKRPLTAPSPAFLPPIKGESEGGC